MTDQRDQAFLKICVAKRLLDHTLARDAYQRAQRENRRATAVLVDMGVMAAHTVDAIEREVDRALAPRTIAGFQIGAKLGQGAMGTVYQAEQMSLKRDVALKIMAPHIAADQEACVRFLREARTAAAVNHPNIIGIIDAGQDNGQLFMALELVSGGDASQLAARFNGILPELRALEIIRDCCLGLNALYEAHLIHRDIKPSNIFIARDGTAKLADLGLARNDRGDDRLTVTGFAVGTPAFMSPEQAGGEHDIDIRSDIYSLGATLFALVTGSQPFTGNGPFAIAAKVLTKPAPDPRALNPSVSLPTAAAILRTLSKKPAERFQTPMEMYAALEAAAHELGSDPVAPPPNQRLEPGATPAAATRHTQLMPQGDVMRSAQGSSASSPRTSITPRRRLPQHSSLPMLITAALLATGTGGFLWMGADNRDHGHDRSQKVIAPAQPPPSNQPVVPAQTAPANPPLAPAISSETAVPPVAPTRAERQPAPTPSDAHPPPAPAVLPAAAAHDRPAWAVASGTDPYGSWSDLRLGDETQRMRWIPPGAFVMGSPASEHGHDGWEVQRPVTFSHGFWLADSSCTQELWTGIMDSNPAKHRGAAHLPVEQVSYDDALAFLGRLSTHLHGARARLPTRAEWEYAARAGTTTPYFFGTDPSLWVRYANVQEARRGGTIPVRSLEPSPWGLYDVYGNVCTWVSGGVGPLSPTDTIDPEMDTRDVPHLFHLRGGSFGHPMESCRSARTAILPRTCRNEDVGFRILIEQQAPATGAPAR
jgi:serine/threonine protein kinase